MTCQYHNSRGYCAYGVDRATTVPYVRVMTPQEDKRAQILRLVQANPTMTAAQIGRAVKLSRQRAHLILTKDLGYRLDQRWTRDPLRENAP